MSDKGDPKLSSEAYIFDVEVLDVNDHPPIFNTNEYNMTVAENQINTTVGKVFADDPDKNSVSCYSITGEINESIYMDTFASQEYYVHCVLYTHAYGTTSI